MSDRKPLSQKAKRGPTALAQVAILTSSWDEAHSSSLCSCQQDGVGRLATTKEGQLPGNAALRRCTSPGQGTQRSESGRLVLILCFERVQVQSPDWPSIHHLPSCFSLLNSKIMVVCCSSRLWMTPTIQKTRLRAHSLTELFCCSLQPAARKGQHCAGPVVQGIGDTHWRYAAMDHRQAQAASQKHPERKGQAWARRCGHG